MAGGHSFSQPEGDADVRVDMGSADPADRRKGDQAARPAEQEPGDRSSGCGVRQPGPDRRSITVIEDHDREADRYQQRGADTFRQIYMKDFSTHIYYP